MRNINTIIFNSDLTVKSQTEKSIQAFSSYQNIIRVVVPFGYEYIPFGIFHATNNTNDVGSPAQFILMVANGTTTVDGEDYYVYEQKVPEAVVSSLRGTKIEFVLSLWGKETNFIGVQRYDETDTGYNDTTYIAGKLLLDFPNANNGEYVRVFNTETDWQFNGSVWVDSSDTFESILEDYRSEIVEFALYKGKTTGQPTHKPSNTEAIIDAINLKVSKTGDTMTGALEFTNANQTRLIMGDNDITTDGQINATTFDNGVIDTDAIKYTDLATLFDVTAVDPANAGGTWLTTYATAIASKFNTYATLSYLTANHYTKTYIDNTFVPLNRTIAGLDLQDNITLNELKSAIGTATSTLDGLLSSTDKQALDNLVGLLDTDDGDNLVDTLGEILEIFENYPEGVDLVTALNGKSNVGHTHTESDITDLDKYTTGQIDTFLNNKIDLDGENSALTVLNFVNGTTANVTYNSDAQVLEVATPDGTTLQVGGELWFANGKASGSIANGDLVQFAGVQGDHYLLKTAVTSEINANPDLFVGIATHEALDNEWVKATWFGEISDVNTNGWSVGDILYFDNVNGGLNNVEPTNSPIIQVAAVVKEETAPSANNGRLLVRPQFISRDAKEVFVADAGGYYNSNNLENVLQEIPSIIENVIDSVDALKYVGVFNADTETTFPNGDKGDLYKVSVSGTVDGVDLEIGDILICNTDGTTGQTANWDVLEGGFDQSLVQDHLDATNNPHDTSLANLTDTTITNPTTNHALVHDGTDFKNRALTKTDVGLNNVQNYGVASQVEAEAGVLNDKYMTPLRTEQQINKPRATKYFTDTVTIQYDSDDDSINFTFGV